MKKQEKLLDAIGLVGEDLIQAAQKQKRKASKLILKWLTPAVAVVLVAGLVFGGLFWPENGWDQSYLEFPEGTPDQPTGDPDDEDTSLVPEGMRVLAAADYPDTASYLEGDERNQWFDEQEMRNQKAVAAGNISGFLRKSLPAVLSNGTTENKIYSPLNVYIALAMLTEVTEGESRQQILDLLGVSNVETLRKKCKALWNANYRDDGAMTSILASSVWLDDVLTINQATVERLAKNYYASSYRGDLGSDEMNDLLQNWLNEQTGGLLAEQIKNVEMNSETVLALATTIYYRAKWSDEFSADQTMEMTFYAPEAEIKCDFLRKTYEGGYFKGENYQVAYQGMERGGGMYFILPDEGVDPQSLMDHAQIADIIAGAGSLETYEIKFSVPKFDVASQTELKDTLKGLGVQNIFDSTLSEFNLEYAEGQAMEIVLSKVQHDARVKIDEEGCEAAAYTVEMAEGITNLQEYPKVTFEADRPFIFAITSEYDLPLFVGTVYQP